MRDKSLVQALRHHQQQERAPCDVNKARFAWLHIPKTGSSLATALFHAANASLPSSARLPVCTHDGLMRKAEVPWRNISTRSLCRNISRRGQVVTACEVLPTERCRGGQAELRAATPELFTAFTGGATLSQRERHWDISSVRWPQDTVVMLPFDNYLFH